MNFVTNVIKEFISLFVDDGSLAVWSLVLIAGVSGAVKFGGVAPLAGGVVLIVGCLMILAASVHRAARRS